MPIEADIRLPACFMSRRGGQFRWFALAMLIRFVEIEAGKACRGETVHRAEELRCRERVLRQPREPGAVFWLFPSPFPMITGQSGFLQRPGRSAGFGGRFFLAGGQHFAVGFRELAPNLSE